MVRVGEVTDDEAPVALLVDNNQMALHRMNGILSQRGYRIIECEDGDAAVDLFVTENPDLVVLSLDIPTLDGHVAALEMREARKNARIIFTAPRSQAELARDAAFSAGAVAVLEKPVSKSSVEQIWEAVEGDIPEAPGLEDLDKLYPELEEEVEVELDLGALPLPPPPSALPALGPPPKRRKKGRGLLLFSLLLFAGAVGAIGYGLYTMGYLSI
jgi:CheY-like chemotaxis protein